MATKKSKKKILYTISDDLRSFDFEQFDFRKNKKDLMEYIQYINSKLGKLLRDFK